MDDLYPPKKGQKSCCNTSTGWFRSPRDISCTIDTPINGKNKPSGYDSNSLVTILRSSQCFTASLTAIIYIFTLSAPSFWLIIFSAATVAVSIAWSMLALFQRHRYSVWLAIVEVLVTVAWIVLFSVSCTKTAPATKEVTFYLALITMEASMIFWIPTCLLVMTPLFHKMMPKVFGVQRLGNAGPANMMNGMPGIGTTTPGNLAYPASTHPGPLNSDIGSGDYGTPPPMPKMPTQRPPGGQRSISPFSTSSWAEPAESRPRY